MLGENITNNEEACRDLQLVYLYLKEDVIVFGELGHCQMPIEIISELKLEINCPPMLALRVSSEWEARTALENFLIYNNHLQKSLVERGSCDYELLLDLLRRLRKPIVRYIDAL